MVKHAAFCKNDDKYSCSVAKTKVNLVCLQKLVVLRYQRREQEPQQDVGWSDSRRKRERLLGVYVRVFMHERWWEFPFGAENI